MSTDINMDFQTIKYNKSRVNEESKHKSYVTVKSDSMCKSHEERKKRVINIIASSADKRTLSFTLPRASKPKKKKMFSEKFLVPVAIETICSPDGDKRSKLQRRRVEP